MKTKHLFIAVMALALALGLPGSVIAQDKDTVRIGCWLPMTGGVAAYGQMEYAGVQVAREMKPTVLGKKVELFLADTKSDKIEAATAMDRLLKKNKVHAVIGEAISGNTMAGAPIADKAKIPVVAPTATNPLVTQNREYIFRVCFIDPFQGEVAAKYAYNTMKARRAALIVDIAQDYCVGLANFFTKSFTKLGGKVVATTYCQTGDQDFTAQLSAIMAAKPDFLYLPNYYTEDALVCKQAEELGLKVPVMSADGAQAPELLSIGGKAVEGFLFTGHFAKEAAKTDIAKKYIAAYEKKTGKEASGFDALGADAYFAILDAMERAKSTDGPKVRAALANTKNFKGVSGVINIGPDGNAVKSMVILQVKNGKFQYLTTVNP
ncbi:MAG TPA: ABC transporter substrate-binding protein [Syntrophales bacterium]|jgi:branched-chain amino acid transport system substrate-binding protein|nr:ABC transporter substrate-binding protein [Syntrophales bacterium]HRT61680.1 ABC transporter substrate-binding protein [Syntrophales bacterium]